ncbi:MAG: insulinase family protein [Clostridia bacterium]|nr:insulinase family protein [Clostridia bacterium]
MKIADKIHGFTVTGVQPVPEIGATLTIMRHDGTGARLLWMDNSDENKLFSIAFKTIPGDDTGIFHILEHSVLGGSKKYPVKEPFLELMKSSMNTFLNAMTFPDKTMFPVSSRNDADFMNLTRVYLDAVFCPAIYDNPGIFQQEGWHIELRDPSDEPLYKGVVFNEMKGAYSSVYRRMGREIERMLFPDTCYGFSSGGDPAAIPNLTYEQFLAGHRTFYHPSNAYIYLDGPVDIDAVLALIDEYIGGCGPSDAARDIDWQQPIAPAAKTAEYEIAPDEPMEMRTHVAVGKVLGGWQDREKLMALHVIGEALAGSNDAPLKRALLDTGLCRDVSLDVEDGVLQPYGVLEILNTDPEHVGKLLDTVRETAAALIEKGFDREDLAAVLNRLEFRERDGQEPRGLIRNINILSSWLYGGDPLMYVTCDSLFAFLREQLETDYYENLAREWLLDESGRATLTMLPSREYGAKLREAEAARLKAVSDAWTDADRAAVIEANAKLDAWQQSVDTPEQLATMPQLPLSEVSEKPLPLRTEAGVENGLSVLFHPAREKGLVSLTLYFSLADRTEEELSRLSVMGGLLGSLPTAKRDGPSLQRAVKSLLGEIHYKVEAFGARGKPETCKVFFAVKARFLEKNLSGALALIAEILTETQFDRTDVVKELLLQADEETRQRIISAGNRYAMGRARAALSAESAVAELTGGFEAYRRRHALLDKADEAIPALAEALSALQKTVFTRTRLTASVTAVDKPDIAALNELLPLGEQPAALETAFRLSVPAAQGILIPSTVSYTGYALPEPVEDMAVWRVASTILSLEYLWNEVRVKGGAYGAGATLNRLGEAAFYSYRDPSPAKTLETCRGAAAFLRAFCADGKALDRYIISTIAQGEPLQSDSERGDTADAMWMRGVTEAERQAERTAILAVTADSVASICPRLEEKAAICVVASQNALDGCGSLAVESI